MQITTPSLLQHYAVADALRPQFHGMFGEALDLVFTPGATGEAPLGLHTMSNHVFNKSWTLLHAPCMAIPARREP